MNLFEIGSELRVFPYTEKKNLCLDPVSDADFGGSDAAVCGIVAAGELREAELHMLSAFPFVKGRDLLIAADGGVCYLKEAGLTPDVIVGDSDSYFDSVSKETVNASSFQNAMQSFAASSEILSYPVEKDDTDMMLAIKLGFSRGYRSFCIFGALGGMLYHTVANLQSLLYIAENGGTGVIYDNGNRIVCIKNSILYLPPEKEVSEGSKFSVFSFSGKSSGVSVQGAKYCLENAVLTNSFPLGAGNSRLAGHPLTIGVENGTLLIIL